MQERIKVGWCVGLDVSERWSWFYTVKMSSGAKVEEGRVRTTPEALRQHFGAVVPQRIALEVGCHSPWISRLLTELGHQVLVANAYKVALIHGNSRKHDRVDARILARLARVDPLLLHPIRHRGETMQHDLALVRSREALIKARTQLINHVRGSVKAVGARLPSCSSECFPTRVRGAIPTALERTLVPVLDTIAQLTQVIRSYERRIIELGRTRYPETALLRQVTGVGPITALVYRLVLEDPTRFGTSRAVGAYLGLVPRLDRSGASDPQLRVTKEGDGLLRRLLVGSAQYVLGPFGPDCDLRCYGERIASRGGRIAKKKAVVAVARKLAILLHHLWVTGEVYEPLRTDRRQRDEKPAA